MLAASQDINNFIERQRSKLNKTTNRQPVDRQYAPPPPPQSLPPNNLEDRLDFKVARILDEPSPRVQSQQLYFPPSPPPPFPGPSFREQQQQAPFFPEQQRHSSNDTGGDNPMTFFDRFGAHEEKRSQLNEDRKREYNEYLRSQQRGSKSKSTSQTATPRGNTTRRVQFQDDGLIVAPWEKNDGRTTQNVHNINDLSSTVKSTEYTTNRSRSRVSQGHDEQYIRDREEYILELYSQIRELEARRLQLETDSKRYSTTNSSSTARAHYTEDLNALNMLLAERLDQRNAVDLELARILNRPPISTSPSLIGTGGVPGLNRSFEQSYESSSQNNQQQHNMDYSRQQYRNDNRSRTSGGGGGGDFQIGRESDRDAEQAAKKRYQQELQSQMRETQMRKVQSKQEKDEYERKLEAEIKRYNYFGRGGGGGGAPMRDKDGNVVANLADLRNPPQQQYPSSGSQQQQPYSVSDDKVYSLGGGGSSITNAPFYNGEQQQYPSNTGRPGSPNHTRGAVNNGIFGTAKTDEQMLREERYKQDLKRQIDEKRQKNAEDLARRRAEEERELAKHAEWQQQMDKQTADEASRKQEKEVQERQFHQQQQDELERQKQQEEMATKRKAKRSDKPITPRNDDNNGDRQNIYDQQESAYRSSSPPVPTLKNKDKKPKAANGNVRRQSFDDTTQRHSPQFLTDNDDLTQPPVDDNDGQGRQSYQKAPTPRQPDVPSARKKPPQAYRPRPAASSNPGMPIRTNSMTSLRSDGSDSEVLNRLEHLKRQLKDKEARLHQHVNHRQTEAALLSDIEEHSTVAYRPPSQRSLRRKQSPGYLLNTSRLNYRDFPSSNDNLLRVLQTDDDDEFKPSYFRDDSILMRGAGGHTGGEYISSSKRVDLVDGMFVTNIEDTARRRRYGNDPPGFYNRDDPTSMANLELSRITEQNEHRLKKLRDLEKDDTSLLDSNEVLERFQQKQRIQRGGSQTTLQDDAWLK